MSGSRALLCPLEDQVGYWLRFVSNFVSTSLARRLDELEISVSEWVALRKLYDGKTETPTELGESMGMTKAPISRLVERLVEKDLVRRRASREDGRARHIQLTAAGRRLVPQLAAMAEENEREFFGALPENTRAALIAILRQVVWQSEIEQAPAE